MFKKLAKKYGAPNPLDLDEKTESTKELTTASPFATSNNAATSFVFGDTNKLSSGNQSSNEAPTPTSNFGKKPVSFGKVANSKSSTPLLQAPIVSSTPFGQKPAAPSTTPFVQTPVISSTPFGAPIAAREKMFGGRTTKEIVISFYQQHNPAQLPKIDQVLQKYAGKEEQLLLNLAKKYMVDPSTIGLSSTTGASQGSGFGTGAPSFGKASGFGATFGASSQLGQSGGFGNMTAQASSPFGQNPGTNSSGFGSFQTNQCGAGLPSMPANSGGSGFGSFPPQNTSPFGAARR
jgi:hypothetical protein